MEKLNYKRLLKKNPINKKKPTGFKKNYFFYSKQHQKYIDFDKKNHTGDGNFLYSNFLTYINVIPFSRPPFFFAIYLGMIVPQMLFLFRRLKEDGESMNWVKGVLYLCVFFGLLNLFYWFFDLFIETNNIGKHNQKINASISYGFTIFMLSEICVFGGLFWGFFDRAFHPSVSLQSLYMPSGTHGLPGLALVFKGSFLLSLSCSAFNAMKRNLMLSENNRARFWGFMSLCIGLTFLFQQVEEYRNIPYMMSVNAHCSFFYAITGLHGFHVAIGILFIGAIVDRIEQEKFNQYDLMSVTFAEIYWYFVDLVWFVLLVALYAYGVYHPNCILIEKYTPVDEWKDFIDSFGYILSDYLESYNAVVKEFYSSWIEKIKETFSFYGEIINWWFLTVSTVLWNPLQYGLWYVKVVFSILINFFNPEYVDFFYSVVTHYLMNTDIEFLMCYYIFLIENGLSSFFFLFHEMIGMVPLNNLLHMIYCGYNIIHGAYWCA